MNWNHQPGARELGWIGSLLRKGVIKEFFPKFNIMWYSISPNFGSCQWGSSLTVCAYLTVGSSPHQAHMSAESPSNISPQPLRSHTRSFGILGQLLKIPPFSAHSPGGRGGPQMFFWLESFFFCELGALAKFWNPTTTPSWILLTALRKREEDWNLK